MRIKNSQFSGFHKFILLNNNVKRYIPILFVAFIIYNDYL
jgi:hypothetical protein